MAVPRVWVSVGALALSAQNKSPDPAGAVTGSPRAAAGPTLSLGLCRSAGCGGRAEEMTVC